MFAWLKRLFQGTPKSQAAAAGPGANPARSLDQSLTTAAPVYRSGQAAARPESPATLRSQEEASAYLKRINEKVSALATRFAAGGINRVQFHELYAHYQNEKQTIEGLLAEDHETDEWKNAVTEGVSVLIRHCNVAHVLGFSIYDNESGVPLKSIGQFGLDPDLFVPMLSSYRSAAQEIFGAGLQSTQIEGGRWLCFVPGAITTTLAIFSTEPSSKQLKTLEELQKIFETANRNQLLRGKVDLDTLVCPHEFFLRHPL